MKFFRQIFGKSNSYELMVVNQEERQVYCSMEYNVIRDTAGLELMVQLLRNVEKAIGNQPALGNDIYVLAEKAFQKIDIRLLLIQKEASCQMLCKQFDAVLYADEFWTILQKELPNFRVSISENFFREVAFEVKEHLKILSKKEKKFIEDVAYSCINCREDGRIEIIFPGEMWGNNNIIGQNIKRAENAGICFVDVPASPISKKAILPEGWYVADGIAREGYTAIFDLQNRMRGIFRITILPNENNNGEVDFFFDIDGLESPNQRMARLPENNCARLNISAFSQQKLQIGTGSGVKGKKLHSSQKQQKQKTARLPESNHARLKPSTCSQQQLKLGTGNGVKGRKMNFFQKQQKAEESKRFYLE